MLYYIIIILKYYQHAIWKFCQYIQIKSNPSQFNVLDISMKIRYTEEEKKEKIRI